MIGVFLKIKKSPPTTIIIIIIYFYHALMNAMSALMIHINLNMILYTYVEHSPTKTGYIKYYTITINHCFCNVERSFQKN